MEGDPSVVVSNLVSLGFTAWLAWYLIVHAIPKINEQHIREREAVRLAHTESRIEDRNEFLRSLREIKEQHFSALQVMQDKFDQSVKEQRETCKQEMEMILEICKVRQGVANE